MLRLTGVLLACFALSGCMDVQDLFLESHAKVNKAFPPDAEIRAAERQLRAGLGGDAARLEAFDERYESQLEQRALACMHLFSVGFLDTVESVREFTLGGACLKTQDDKLRQYLGARQIEARVSQAKPGAPLPPASDTEGVMQVHAGGAAGAITVSLQGKRGEFTSLRLPDGKLLLSAPGADGSPPPNGYRTADGRVTAIHPTDGGATFFDAQSGRNLWQAPADRQWLAWMPEVSVAWARDKRSGEVTLVDMPSGKVEPGMADVFGAVNPKWVLPLSGHPARALVGKERGFSLVGLEREDAGIKLTTIKEYTISYITGEMVLPPTLMRDGGTVLFVTSREFMSYDLASGKGAQWPVPGLKLAGYGKLSETTLLVDARKSDGSDGEAWVFDMEQSALLPVDAREAKLDILSAFSRQAVAMPLEKRERVGIMEIDANRRRAMVAQRESLMRVESNMRMARAQAEQRLRTLSPAPAPAPAAPSYASASPSDGSTGRLASWALDAKILAVGVYRGENVTTPVAASRRKMGQVEVRVRPSFKPVLLVLISREPVRWVLTLEPGAKLNGLLVSGRGESEVVGANFVRMVYIGNVAAHRFESPEYATLNQEVARLTGRGIDVFQGSYDGGVFNLGG